MGRLASLFAPADALLGKLRHSRRWLSHPYAELNARSWNICLDQAGGQQHPKHLYVLVVLDTGRERLRRQAVEQFVGLLLE